MYASVLLNLFYIHSFTLHSLTPYGLSRDFAHGVSKGDFHLGFHMAQKPTTQQWLALIGVSLLVFTLFLDVTIVANALPTIQDELAATNTQLQWLPGAIYTSFCAFMIVMGRIGGVYGLRKIFYGCMVVFALASLACGLANTIEQLIFFRFIQGISAACVSLGPALVAMNFSRLQQARAMGLFSGIAGSGLVLGAVLGGLIVDFLDWRWIFFVMIPFIALGLILCAKNVKENVADENKEKIDWLGAALLVIAVMSLVGTTMQAEIWGWGSSLVLGGYATFIISLILFVLVGSRSKHPIMPFHILFNRTSLACIAPCIATGTFIGVLLFLNPLYLQIILGKTATSSGWLLFIVSIMFVITTPIAGILTEKIGAKPATVIVPVTLIFAALCHAFFTVEGSLFLIVIGFAFFGIAWGAVNVGPSIAVINKVGEKKSGIAIGAMWTFFNLSAALGLAIMGELFRYWEKRDILEKFADKSIELTQSNLTLISQFVTDPEVVQRSAANFYERHLPIFKLAFVESLNYVSWVLFGLALLSFVVVFVVMEKE